MQEVWKDVEGYEDIYQVSNIGNVKSKRFWTGSKYIYRDKILKPSKSSSGYLQVIFSKNGKTKSKFIHKLVASAFLENKNNYKEVNHKDENKENNNINNLEWCNHKYNMNYGNIKEKLAKKKEKRVAKYDKDGNLISIYNSIKEASIKNNVQSNAVVACCKYKKGYKTCGGYIWKYS